VGTQDPTRTVKEEGPVGAAKVHEKVLAECHMHASEAGKLIGKLDEMIDLGEIEKLPHFGLLVGAYQEAFPYDPRYIRELLHTCMEGTTVVKIMKVTYCVAVHSDFYVSEQLKRIQNTDDECEKKRLIANLRAFHARKQGQITKHVRDLLSLQRKGLAQVQGACKAVGAIREEEDEDDYGSNVEGDEEDDCEDATEVIPVKQKSVRQGRTAGQRRGKYLSKLCMLAMMEVIHDRINKLVDRAHTECANKNY
jgi:hypothetical protein